MSLVLRRVNLSFQIFVDLDIPANSEVLVTATETGIDVTLAAISVDRVPTS